MFRPIMWSSVRTDLKTIYERSVNAVKPDTLINNYINITENELIVKNSSQEIEKKFSLEKRDIYIVGAGKAVLKMCEQFLNQLEAINNTSNNQKLWIKSGILSVPMGTHTSSSLFAKYNVQYKTGALNNIPDINSQRTTHEIIDLVKTAKSYTLSSNCFQKPLIISFISGGGSALLALPKPGITLDQKCQLISKLVKSGVNINQLNSVRRCLSQVKCGKLAHLAISEPNSVELICFIISDIINDPIELIASGPTVICKSDALKASQNALKLIEELNIDVNEVNENIKTIITSDDRELDSFDSNSTQLHNIIIGNNSIALKVAQNTAKQLGYKVLFLGNTIDGEASDVAIKWAQMAIDFKETEEDLKNYKGICWIAGGETTVTMTNSKTGLGGRCQEMGLVFYRSVYNIHINGKLCLLCAGTDGQDGPTEFAGVIAENILKEDSNEHIFEQSKDDLINHNSYNFFKNHYPNWFIDTQGVTGTNVMDIYCMIKCFKP